MRELLEVGGLLVWFVAVVWFAMEHAERRVRRILSDACPYYSAPMEDDPGRVASGDVDMAWTCGTWRRIDGETFRSDGCGAREVADDA